MPIPDPAAQSELFAKGRRVLQSLVEELAALPAIDPQTLCSHGIAAIDAYANELLAQFVAEMRPETDEELAWLKRQYLSLILEFATGIRDSIPDTSTRHAIVQSLQCKILEQERELRSLFMTNRAVQSVGTQTS